MHGHVNQMHPLLVVWLWTMLCTIPGMLDDSILTNATVSEPPENQWTCVPLFFSLSLSLSPSLSLFLFIHWFEGVLKWWYPKASILKRCSNIRTIQLLGCHHFGKPNSPKTLCNWQPAPDQGAVLVGHIHPSTMRGQATWVGPPPPICSKRHGEWNGCFSRERLSEGFF